jgi:hypothetical protein
MKARVKESWKAQVYPIVLPIVRSQLTNRAATKAIEAILAHFLQEGYEWDAIGPALIKSRLKEYLTTIGKEWVEPPKPERELTPDEEAKRLDDLKKQAIEQAIASLGRMAADAFRLSKQGLKANDVAQKCGISTSIAEEYIMRGRVAEAAAFQRLTAKTK